jgi:N-acetylglucosaminyldiphosphoundecaprenol N-acetyl-beta-D-mannosaminyltransferase
MRILVATDQWFPDVFGGSARVAAETARALAARGHDVTVLAPVADGRPREEQEGRLRLLRVLPRSPLPQTVTDVIAARRAARNAGVFDVMLAHQPTVAVGLSAAGLDAPLVTVFHASPALEARYFARRRPWSGRGLAARALAPVLSGLEATALRRSERVLVLSEFSRALAVAKRAWLAPKVGLVPGGADVEQFSPGHGQAASRERLGLGVDVPLLFAARRLEPRMGLDVLLHALTLMPDTRLALAGTGTLGAELRGLADELGVSGRVSFLDGVLDEELPDWYRAADVVVVPTVAYEGFGLTMVEALACGTPVVGTSVGAIPEVLGPLDERLVAAGTDATALAAAVSVALGAGPELRRRCSEYASTRFSWQQLVAEWEEQLLSVATQTRGEPQRYELFGVPLDQVSLSEAVAHVDAAIQEGRPAAHASVNAAKVVRVQTDFVLADALRRCSLVTADGQPVVWAARLARCPLPERVAGIDLMEALLELAERRRYRLYLLGARSEVLEAARAEILRRHPQLELVGAEDGYFAAEDEGAVVARIASVRPDMLFVAMGTPQQELFLARRGDELGVGFAMGVGGAFNVFAGSVKRAPAWAQQTGLEWFFRLAQEPRRLLSRYFVGNARFLAIAAREVVRARTSKATSEACR